MSSRAWPGLELAGELQKDYIKDKKWMVSKRRWLDRLTERIQIKFHDIYISS